jgi:hypothetical protein
LRLFGVDGGDEGFGGEGGFGEAHAGGLFHHEEGAGGVIGLAAIATGFAEGFFDFDFGEFGFHAILYGEEMRTEGHCTGWEGELIGESERAKAEARKTGLGVRG